MISLSTSRIIIGYHGCDRALTTAVLQHQTKIKPSQNTYDWLGHGVYFWEHSPSRALQFAQEQRARGKVNDPAVLGAMIFLGECLDLTDPAHTAELRDFYPSFAMQLQVSDDARLPHNSGGKDLLLRHLDCAMSNSYMKFRDGNRIDKPYHYQTVRGIFVEGEPAYPGAAIYTKSHIQIAVRDPQCILGYFTPNLKDEV